MNQSVISSSGTGAASGCTECTSFCAALFVLLCSEADLSSSLECASLLAAADVLPAAELLLFAECRLVEAAASSCLLPPTRTAAARVTRGGWETEAAPPLAFPSL